MQRTILTILGAALVTTSMIQIAAAAEHHKARTFQPAPGAVSEPFRNSNAALPSSSVGSGWSRYEEPGWSRYQNGAMSAPAGR